MTHLSIAYTYVECSSHCCCVIFFFSSRRRHTRCLSDWSSDVCSSDLGLLFHGSIIRDPLTNVKRKDLPFRVGVTYNTGMAKKTLPPDVRDFFEIGRASCR